MSKVSREELFKRTAAQKEQEKEERERSRNSNNPFTEITYAPLHNNSYAQFRILGNPAEARMEDNTSPKIIYYSMIRGDDDKLFRCIWPDPTEGDGKTWILWKIYNKILSYTWDAEKSERHYHHKESHPLLFNRVFKNGRPDVTLERGWKPTVAVLMNVIDRSMMNWHDENKHTAIISKKVTESSSGSLFYEPGIPKMVYDELWSEIVENSGDWQDYDVVIYKTTTDPFYRVYHAVDDVKKFADKWEEGQQFAAMADAPLTNEQRSWERYDLDKLFPITSFTKIHNRLSSFIRSVDDAFQTRYADELDRLVADEKKARESKTQAQIENFPPEDDNDGSMTTLSGNEFDDDDVEETDEFISSNSAQDDDSIDDVFDEINDNEQPVRTRKSKNTTINWKELAESYEGISKLTNEEKNQIESFDADKGTFVYKNKSAQLFACTTEGCTMLTPESFHACPGCGVEFDE